MERRPPRSPRTDTLFPYTTLCRSVSAETIAALTGESPRDLALYREALTHGSSGAGDYQRLEFLGDRVLGLVIASELFRRFPKAAEGELSSRLQIGRAHV